jgi:hypothetical protein
MPSVNLFSLLKSRSAKAGLLLFFFSMKTLAFLPGGKLENYSFKEQSALHNYKILGSVGFVSQLNHIFSAENATIVISSRNNNEIQKELHCDEITYELDNSYLHCAQGLKYLSFNLEVD